MIRPPLLREGGAVVSLASPAPALRPGRFGRGVRALETMGFRERVGRNARAMAGHTAGTVEQRLSDQHDAFAEGEEVRAIICSIGSHNSNQLVDRLDYGLVRANPRILVGYGDVQTPPSPCSKAGVEADSGAP